MDAQRWKELLSNGHAEELLDRLDNRQGPPVAFMVGSALSSPAVNGAPGVPGVDGTIAIAREFVARLHSDRIDDFDKALEHKEGSDRYAAAFQFLQSRMGQNIVNDVARTGVLQARKAGAKSFSTDEETELDVAGWTLSRGMRALGELIARYPRRYPGPIMTTNYDPLLSIAVEVAGRRTRLIIFDRDRDPPSPAEDRGNEAQIIHLHGYWRQSATMHTITQLRASREKLEDWCRETLRGRLLVVVAYGGWDDSFTRLLASSMGTELQVVWTFYSDHPDKLIGSHSLLLERLEPWLPTGLLQVYTGIDGHDLFERLLERITTTEQSAAPTSIAERGELVALPRSPVVPLSDASSSLRQEQLVLRFENVVDPMAEGILSILEDYYFDLNSGKLRDFHFSTDQIAVIDEPEYSTLAQLFIDEGSRENRRMVQRLEGWLTDGTRTILDLAYVQKRQVPFCWLSIAWFARAIRHWAIALMRRSLPRELLNFEFGRDCLESPLLGPRNHVEQFYGTSLIRLELWDPRDSRIVVPCYFPRDGRAGEWFEEAPQLSGEYLQHFNPTEHYTYVLPQMIMRSLVNSEPIVTDFAAFWIGSA